MFPKSTEALGSPFPPELLFPRPPVTSSRLDPRVPSQPSLNSSSIGSPAQAPLSPPILLAVLWLSQQAVHLLAAPQSFAHSSSPTQTLYNDRPEGSVLEPLLFLSTLTP